MLESYTLQKTIREVFKMAFIDREVEFPNRYFLEDENGGRTGPFTLVRDEGTVTEEGTLLNADNLNREIESIVNDELSGLKNGSTTMILTGTKSCKCSSAKTPRDIAITFKTAFSSAPRVTVSVVTSNPQNQRAGIRSVTKTGFSIRFYSTNTSSYTVHWQAIL